MNINYDKKRYASSSLIKKIMFIIIIIVIIFMNKFLIKGIMTFNLIDKKIV